MALFFIQGFMLDEDLWRDVEPGLQPFAPFIHTDMTKDGSIEDLVDRALADAPPSFILAGFSLGGYVAREMARRAPERVRALILISTSARGDGANQAARKASAGKHMSRSNFNGLSRSAIVKSLHPDRADDTEMIERIRVTGVRLGPDVFVRQSGIIREDGTQSLAEIRVPTLVVAAAQDALRSLDQARELQHGIPGAVMTIVKNSGHMIPIEVPEILSQIIGTWLRSLALT